ncbi:MAG: PAS domain S-box protein [Cytophagales bacterium]|uniref:PAS domain S-box protein n=1 Tax=Cyclobacterium marinum TaxID=104 RepID=UPI0030DA4055|nr:PAS domain S-box protein [Cytophagales bacterium]
MNYKGKSKEELIKELQKLEKTNDVLRLSLEKEKNNRIPEEKCLRENSFLLMVQNSPDVIWTLDKNYRYTYISPSISKLRGLLPEEAMKEKIQDTISLDSQEDFFDAIADLRDEVKQKSYQPVTVEVKQNHKNGHIIWVEIVINAYFNEQGDQIGYMGISREITQRKIAEIELLEKKGKYHTLTENMKEVVWSIDTESMLIDYVSPSIIQLLGYTSEEILSGSIELVTTRKTLKIIHKQVDKAKDNFKINSSDKDNNYHVEVELLRKDGSKVWVELTSRFVKNRVTGQLEMYCRTRNITERKLAEEALKSSLERFDTLVAMVSVGVYIFWIRSNGHMEFEYVSDRWRDIHDVRPDEDMTDITTVNNKIHKDDIEDFLLANMEAARDRKPFVWEGRFNIKNDERWFRIESIPIGYENGDIRWFGVTQDITERYNAEEALRKSEEKLRELNAQKDKFFSIIAHDLKNPFNAIMGLSQLLIDQIKEKDYEGIEEYGTYISESTEKAMNLLVNLLNWARSQTGRMEFNPENFEIVELIEENKMLLAGNASQKLISIKTSLPEKLTVFADKQMISTVIRNLLSNAIKFTKENKEILITVKENPENIHVSIKDQGIGIAADRLEKLFRIDSSVSTPDTNNERGTGLGLILCKEFVVKHGGNIGVDSEKGKGSTFYFTLPKNG